MIISFFLFFSDDEILFYCDRQTNYRVKNSKKQWSKPFLKIIVKKKINIVEKPYYLYER